jgi:hypothetical protein
VSQHLGGGQVVDSDNLEALSAEHLAESQTADTTETVNSNLNRHGNYLHFIAALSQRVLFGVSAKSIFPERLHYN